MAKAVKIRLGTVWRDRSDPDRLVRVIAPDLAGPRVMYQVVPDGRTLSTWVDRFLARYDPEPRARLRDIVMRLRRDSRAGDVSTLLPHESRLVLRALKSESRRDSVSPATVDTHAD